MEHMEELQLAGPYAVTRDSYDRCAKAYDQWATGFSPYKEAWDAFINELGDVPQVLDLGCGSGAFLAEVHQLRPLAELSGYDFGAQMLQIARQKLPLAHLQLADITEIDIPQKGMDAVLLSGCLTHLLPTQSAMLIMQSLHALRHGGLLYASFTEAAELEVERGHFETASFGGENQFFCTRSIVPDMMAAISSAGFEIKSLERIAYPDGNVMPWHAGEVVVHARRK